MSDEQKQPVEPAQVEPKEGGKDKGGKKKEKGPKSEGGEKQGYVQHVLNPPPAYLATRVELFERLYKIQQDEIAAKAAENVSIKVTLRDGREMDAVAFKTTPYDIAKTISNSLANDCVISRVNGELWDLDRPFEGPCTIEFLNFDDHDGQQVFWHSSAHVLGEAMELHLGGCLCYGPPIENGFYYDTFLDGKPIAEENFKPLEELAKRATNEKQNFQRLEMTKADLLEMFKYNPFKVRIINEKIDTPTTTVYRCGPLIDLCRGPHVRHTGKIKAFAVLKSSSTYWEGKAECETLQRVYGISFPDTKLMKEWKTIQEEAAKRDHRKLGKEQELFFFHELSPGSCFFLPHGAHIYNTLCNFIRNEYHKRGFTEVVSPNIYNSKLWETSGHWQHYKENMFSFESEKETFALKPMNCPGHCLMFQHRNRSYRELPIRFADFGVLHRNELSGALTGLTRVRRFQQDDAHIFCMPSQIESEIEGALDFLRHVYTIFGFTFQLNLSTRPEKYLGSLEVWNAAEEALKRSLDKFGHPWKLNPGDGAFYGPKIDITIQDALKRNFQCATIQLDFQLPIRFGLEYVPNEPGKKEEAPEKKEGDAAQAEEKHRPVIIHRAILGSVERCIAILTESYGGKWPFWLSPRQAQVVPVHPRNNDYALKVKSLLHGAGFRADVDLDDGNTLNKKIRNAQLAQYNFILVVGAEEEKHNTVNVRTRDNLQHGERTLDQLLAEFSEMRDKFTRDDLQVPIAEPPTNPPPAPSSSSS